ncbi:MAG: precorrin-6A/cobalt-precorrin-6A reductase [Bermanella sp.]
MRLLILGGTAQAKWLAQACIDNGIKCIYSIAGLVRIPQLDCEINIGGFSKLGGLGVFIKREHITAILDATHPYAKKMSDQAVRSARDCNIPVWRYQRPTWLKTPLDNWQEHDDWPDLLLAIKLSKSIFLSAGQPSAQVLNVLSNYQADGQQQTLRTAVPCEHVLPKNMEWIKAIGPFSWQQEFELMASRKIDALITKNSGGSATQEKLKVAQALGIKVHMLKRPILEKSDKEFNDLKASKDFLVDWHKNER